MDIPMADGSVDLVMALSLMHISLYYFITAYQHCFIYGEMPPRDILVAVVLISLGTFLVGFWVFEKMKQLFDDNI